MATTILLLLVACGVSRDSFAEEYVEIACDVHARCGLDTTTCENGEALTAMREFVDCDSFDRDAAAACLDERHEAMDDVSCEDLLAGGAADTPSCMSLCPKE